MILSNILLNSSVLFQYSLFKINQSYIASNLCEQKNIEDNTCCGSCYIEKEINKEDDKTNSKFVFNEVKVESAIINYSFTYFEPIISKIFFADSYKFNYTFNFTNYIFHPPIALV